MADTSVTEPQEHGDIRPMVANTKPSNLGMWAFFAILLLGGIWLFSALSANRVQQQAPITEAATGTQGTRIAAPPPLALPQAFRDPVQEVARPRPVLLRAINTPAPQSRPIVQPAAPRPAPAQIVRPPETPPVAAPSVVFDSAFRPNYTATSPSSIAAPDVDRVSADRFAKPSRTIPQGTVIPAVLETALDSTRAGAARALVQRDIYSFDGSRILIQRGSRLYGEYDSGLEAGQNRALIQWTRLIRPDGVTIALDSPSSDPLGRAGVKGTVDGKFLQRFGGAILQSVLDLGVGLATREVSSEGLVVALPGSTQNLQVNNREQVQRTLKVRHGTSVSVFVARDLDFSTVDP